MKKNLLTTILGLSIAISISAQSGTDGNISWKIEGSTLTISGTGDMPDYVNSQTAPWYNNYRETIKTVVINDGVTSIGEDAFWNCDNLTTITIPNSVKSIRDGAFDLCESLISISIPNSVTSIGVGAFRECRSLTSITIPNSITSIGRSAFVYCALTSVVIPNGVESIEDGTFFGCDNLATIIIPNSVTSIGERVFEGCSSLTSIIIPNSVTNIGWLAFSYCEALANIYSHRAYPPELERDVFDYENISTSTLHVPVGSKQYYQAAEGWKEFYNIVEDATMDITAVTAQENIGIYPNPVSDNFQLTGITNATEITIFDTSGIAVINKVVTPNEAIFIDNLPTGVYFVQVGSKTMKLMKK